MIRTNNLFGLLVLLAIFVFAGISCKKENRDHTVKGKIQNSSSFTGIPGAKVYLKRGKAEIFSSPASEHIASTTTDANGEFTFDFVAEKGYKYAITADAPGYFNNFYTGGEIVDTDKKKSTALVSLQPEAWLKIHIVNTQPFDALDYINTSVGFGPFYGVQVDTIVIAKIYGNKSNALAWYVKKNSINTNYSESIYCPQFDTTFYNINY